MVTQRRWFARIHKCLQATWSLLSFHHFIINWTTASILQQQKDLDHSIYKHRARKRKMLKDSEKQRYLRIFFNDDDDNNNQQLWLYMTHSRKIQSNVAVQNMSDRTCGLLTESWTNSGSQLYVTDTSTSTKLPYLSTSLMPRQLRWGSRLHGQASQPICTKTYHAETSKTCKSSTFRKSGYISL